MDLNGVIKQEVVQNEFSWLCRRVFLVIPEAVKAKHLAVIIQELPQLVVFLIRRNWVCILLKLKNI